MPESETPVTAGELRTRLRRLRELADLVERQLEGVPDDREVSPIPFPFPQPEPGPYPPIPGSCWPTLS